MPTFYSDPISAYEQLSATVPAGEKYTQSGFDYQGKTIKRLEAIYPTAPVFDADGADPWEIAQGGISDCMMLSDLSGLAKCTGPYTVKDCIYPTTVSPIGLYLASIADGLDRKWFAFDSNVPVGSSGKPTNAKGLDGATLWPALMEKASATLKGDSYASLDCTVIQSPNFYWVPSINIPVTTFEEMLRSIKNGGYGRVGFDEQRDASGAVVTIPGLILDHAFGLIDALQVGNHQLIRVSNPWGGGADYNSPLYGDDSQFWIDHPELADKKATALKHGEFWMGWDELMSLGHLTGKMRQPLPMPGYPSVVAFDHVFDAFNKTIGRWPTVKELRKFKTYKFTITEPTEVIISTSWQSDSTGFRHSYMYLTNGVSTTSMIGRGYGWWGGDGYNKVTLIPGTYEFIAGCVDQNVDNGTLQVIVLSEKPVTIV
jgi:Calpain family cysteine protease